jgi:DNA-binding PucR family transcriptional regulator
VAETLSQARLGAILAARLRERLPEIEAAIAARVYAIADPHEIGDPGYLEGLNAALIAAIEHRLDVLERGRRLAPEIPASLLAQARLDARDGVPLDTVLRRYFAGTSLFGDFLVEEAERAKAPSAALRPLLAAQATLGDQLLEVASSEYARGTTSRPRSAVERRRECAMALLAGALVDPADLDYELDCQHLALAVRGEPALEAMRELSEQLDRRLLFVSREEEPASAVWLGGERKLDSTRAAAALGAIDLDGLQVSVGEAGSGLGGWRLSHRQAKTALSLAGEGRRLVRYADVVVLAAVARDDLAATSLRQLYLEPLARARDGGAVARETLCAYFAAERNVSSTAALLGVNRRTVTNRLKAIEETLGRPLAAVAIDLDIALRMNGELPPASSHPG